MNYTASMQENGTQNRSLFYVT